MKFIGIIKNFFSIFFGLMTVPVICIFYFLSMGTFFGLTIFTKFGFSVFCSLMLLSTFLTGLWFKCNRLFVIGLFSGGVVFFVIFVFLASSQKLVGRDSSGCFSRGGESIPSADDPPVSDQMYRCCTNGIFEYYCPKEISNVLIKDIKMLPLSQRLSLLNKTCQWGIIKATVSNSFQFSQCHKCDKPLAQKATETFEKALNELRHTYLSSDEYVAINQYWHALVRDKLENQCLSYNPYYPASKDDLVSSNKESADLLLYQLKKGKISATEYNLKLQRLKPSIFIERAHKGHTNTSKDELFQSGYHYLPLKVDALLGDIENSRK